MVQIWKYSSFMLIGLFVLMEYGYGETQYTEMAVEEETMTAETPTDQINVNNDTTTMYSPTTLEDIEMTTDRRQESGDDDLDDEDHYFFEGDIVIPRELVRDAATLVSLDSTGCNFSFSSAQSKNSVSSKLKLWPNAIMPYVIDQSFSTSEMNIIEGAMDEITEKTCFKFKPRSTYSPELEYVHVVRKEDLPCHSQVGRTGKGRQEINLSPNEDCLHHGTVVHELMHSIGFYHEQTRPERDAYVDIHCDHLIKGNSYKTQFLIQKAAALTTFGLPYDYNSVMHYDRTAYSKDQFDTISQKVGIFYIGQRQGLSATDATRVKLLYGLSDCNCTGFICASTGTCIWSGRRCDYAHDCEDNSDENDCDGDKCPATRFRCASNGECIRSTRRCDGFKHCDDNSDEVDCDTCAESAIQCLSGTLKCASWKARCNGKNECDDGTDEANCTSCSPHDFRCDSGQCVYHNFRCDGVYNCIDKSDELNCTTCNYYRLRCATGDQCIEHELWCNGQKDCGDGSDERDCGNSCPVGAFRCHGDGKCLPLSWQCDGYPRCSDGSDEKDCFSCAVGEFRCDSGQCIPDRQRCDIYKKDCNDGSDEENCPCDPDEHFTCDNGKCTFARWRCNGYEDCEDKSDEKNCTFCSESRFLCDGGRCIHSSRRCNSHQDCEDGTDEKDCPTCPADTFTCDNGQCIEDRFRCNGRRDCYDSSDEVNCANCSGTSIRCDNGLCIPALRGCGRGVCRSGHQKWRCREPLGVNMTSEARRPLFEVEEAQIMMGVEFGKNINLTCTVWHDDDAQPFPQFFWSMNTQKIDPADKCLKIMQKDDDPWTSTLEICNAVIPNHATKFYCLAKNVNGMSIKIFTVAISSPAAPPETSTSYPVTTSTFSPTGTDEEIRDGTNSWIYWLLAAVAIFCALVTMGILAFCRFHRQQKTLKMSHIQMVDFETDTGQELLSLNREQGNIES